MSPRKKLDQPPGRRAASENDALGRRAEASVPKLDLCQARSGDELLTFGLPSKLSREARETVELWRKVMCPPIEPRLVAPELELEDALNYGLGFRSLDFAGRQETSRNWSGVSVAETGENGFLQVWGSWRVPDVSLPRINGGAVQPGDYRCSTWIGVGGMAPFATSLPQIGTTQRIRLKSDGSIKKRFHAWWQWWHKDFPTRPVRITDVPVRPGDKVSCQLTVQAPNQVLFTIWNERTHKLGRVLAVTVLPIPTPVPTFPPLKLQPTAEWITERPRRLRPQPGIDDLYPLPDYGSVEFEGCAAAVGPDPATPLFMRDLAGAREIRMIDTRDGPTRTAVISRGAKRGETRAETRYCGNTG